MIKEAIEKILSLAPVEQFYYDGRTYTNKLLYPVEDSHPAVLKIDTLTGFCDYIEANIDNLALPGGLLVHVQDYLNIFLISRLTESFKQRIKYLLATADPVKFPFGQFMDVETFIIRLQSMFVQDETTEAILKIVGNVKDGTVTQFQDDGVTQQVTAKAGVSRVDNIPVPNPVELAPYRTFLEIEQPKSRFVFRMRSGPEVPLCALFESDGGAWKNEVIVRIRDWLKDKVKGIAIIA
jgi:hypothetical protein